MEERHLNYLPTVKDCNPVMALPRIRAWMSWVPGGGDNTGVTHVEVGAQMAAARD